MTSTLALAGISARLMAQAAVADGFHVLAIDLFGDRDTRALARRWWPLGEPGQLKPDAGRLQAALLAARDHAATGWVAGSGFESRQDLLLQGAQTLPLVGCDPAAVARIRDPQIFFPFLAEQGIPHPAVSRTRPVDGQAWLLKDLHDSGASHIRLLSASAETPVLRPGQYLQRRAPGQAMSALFVADGRRAHLVGFNRQLLRAHPTRPEVPYVFYGVVGPVPLPAVLTQAVQKALDRLVAGFGLRGLCSLDFLLQGESWLALEVNPRPPASLALYPHQRLMTCHVQACLQGELPQDVSPNEGVHGYEIVFARQALRLSPRQADWLGAQPGVHDLPAAEQRFTSGEPLCSITLAGLGSTEVLAGLSARREHLLNHLETSA